MLVLEEQVCNDSNLEVLKSPFITANDKFFLFIYLFFIM